MYCSLLFSVCILLSVLVLLGYSAGLLRCYVCKFWKVFVNLTNLFQQSEVTLEDVFNGEEEAVNNSMFDKQCCIPNLWNLIRWHVWCNFAEKLYLLPSARIMFPVSLVCPTTAGMNVPHHLSSLCQCPLIWFVVCTRISWVCVLVLDTGVVHSAVVTQEYNIKGITVLDGMSGRLVSMISGK